jgi:hypothetical protein
MSACEIDHIVVAAATLDEGARFIRDRLGVDIPMGGKHALMATHNRLMRLGRDSFFEVIAIDPAAPPPSRARWYALDDPAMRERLAESPQLITWVARASDIVPTVQSAAIPLGAIVPVSRDGLSWRLTVPEDGHLPGGGVVPTLIEWDGGVRPWESMADLGCKLEELILAAPDPAALRGTLATLCECGFSRVSVVEGAVPLLSARIKTPSGIVTI